MVLTFLVLLAFLSYAVLAEIEEGEVPDSASGGFCPTCRQPVEDDWLLCPGCRSLLRENCPGCDRLSAAWHIFCPWCGRRRETT